VDIHALPNVREQRLVPATDQKCAFVIGPDEAAQCIGTIIAGLEIALADASKLLHAFR
jgi:hypothetical protein